VDLLSAELMEDLYWLEPPVGEDPGAKPLATPVCTPGSLSILTGLQEMPTKLLQALETQSLLLYYLLRAFGLLNKI